MDTPKKKSHKRKAGVSRLHEKVKTARGRTISSTQWLQRQLNDPYVRKAQTEGYLSRAAYKLLEIDEKFNLLHPNSCVLDLGAAPGGWTQVALQKLHPDKGLAIAVDIQDFTPLKGAYCIKGDLYEEEIQASILSYLAGRKVDVVLSDMAAPATGHRKTDHLRVVALGELALEMGLEHLAIGGALVIKILRGGTEQHLLDQFKQHFTEIKHFKPKASRADSAEMYLIAKGFKA